MKKKQKTLIYVILTSILVLSLLSILYLKPFQQTQIPTSPIKVGCLGDSITSINTYCNKQNFNRIYINETIAQGYPGLMCDALDKNGYYKNLIGKGISVSILYCGINDINTQGGYINTRWRTEKETYGALINLSNYLKNDGQTVVITTLAPCYANLFSNKSGDINWDCTNNNQTEVIRRNNIIRNVSFTNQLCYADIFTDIFTGKWLNGYYSDTVHPNTYAHSLIAPYLMNKYENCQPYNCNLNPNSCKYGVLIENICTPNWQCTGWNTCSNSLQGRTCTDNNNCGTSLNKPIESQSCVVLCTESWQCSSWSSCSSASKQTRTCTDSNLCGTILSKPITEQSCTYSCTPNWNCGNWSTCANSEQTRLCTDLNNCNTASPELIQECVTPTNYTNIIIFGFIVSGITLLSILKLKRLI